LDLDNLSKAASLFLNNQFGKGKWIDTVMNEQVYLNRALIKEKGLNLVEVQNQLAGFLRDKDGIAQVYTATQLGQQEFTQNISACIQKGFYYKRSGDIAFVTEPGWTDDLENASTHGTGYAYDTHVPLLWFGVGIPKGESFVRYDITDIAPTVSAMLSIKLPSACIGNPITEILAKGDGQK
jgi:hypothetical protein